MTTHTHNPATDDDEDFRKYAVRKKPFGPCLLQDHWRTNFVRNPMKESEHADPSREITSSH